MKKIVVAFFVALVAAVTVASDDGFVVSKVISRQRWPIADTVDIDFKLSQPEQYASVAYGAEVRVCLAVDGQSHVLDAKSLNRTCVFGSGFHRISWIPTQEFAGRRIKDAVFTVEIVSAPIHASYMIVDLETGACSYEGIDFTNRVSEAVFKSAKMAFRYCPSTTSAAWAAISGGADCFTIGSPATESGRRGGSSGATENQRQVRLTKGFWIGVYPVTWLQWTKLGGARTTQTASSYDFNPAIGLSYDIIRGADTATSGYRYPTTDKVNPQTPLGRLRSLTGCAFDLPTEAQWEYACRAGTTTRYYWGTSFNSAYITGESAVGQKHPNKWGIYDLIGGVHQWTTTLGRRDSGSDDSNRINYTDYEPAGVSKIDDPEGETPDYDNPYRITRGTHMVAKNDSDATRSAYRFPQKSDSSDYCGCRFALVEGNTQDSSQGLNGFNFSGITVRSREPWEEKVDIDFELAVPSGMSSNDPVKISVAAVDGLDAIGMDEESFDTLYARAGRNRIVWTPSAALKGRHFDCLTLSMKVVACESVTPRYMAVDLATGALAYYPDSYSNEVVSARNMSERMIFRRCAATISDEWKSLSGGKDYFLIGSPSDEKGRRQGTSEDQQQVRLTKDFWFGVFPVTWLQWTRLGGARTVDASAKYNFYPARRLSYETIRGADTATSGYRYPTENAVDSSKPLGILRERTGLAFDLPTESQWEYACRAGTTTRYFWGTSWDDRQNYVTSDSTGEVNPVGRKLPNKWGIYDLIGAVHQWTTTLGRRTDSGSDESNRINHISGDDPKGETPDYDNPYRVARGTCASASKDSSATRSAYRYPLRTSGPEDSVLQFCGCRFALTIGEE